MKVTRAVIPAAGQGTRLGPATKTLAKEMLPMGGAKEFRPFIDYVVQEAKDSGIEHIEIITRPEKHPIEHYLNAVQISGVHYIPQHEQKGLGHAILHSEGFVSGPFAVLLGDDYFETLGKPATKQLLDVYEQLPEGAVLIGVEEKGKKEMTSKGMVLSHSSVDRWETGVQVVDDLIEKPTLEQVTSKWAISGRYVLPQEIFSVLRETPPGAKDEIQLTDALKTYLQQGGPVFAYHIVGVRIDVGTPTSYLEAQIQKLLSSPDREETISILEKYSAQN